MVYFQILCFGVLIMLTSPMVAASDDPDAATCQGLLNNPQSISVSLKALLGEWDSCETTHFKKHEYGIEQTLLVQWEVVKLTVKFQPPESTRYTIEPQGENVLTAEWFITARETLISSYFDIDWSHDMFPGPTSEHYLSKEDGTNGQVWIERDSNGAISWMRFSYAL